MIHDTSLSYDRYTAPLFEAIEQWTERGARFLHTQGLFSSDTLAKKVGKVAADTFAAIIWTMASTWSIPCIVASLYLTTRHIMLLTRMQNDPQLPSEQMFLHDRLTPTVFAYTKAMTYIQGVRSIMHLSIPLFISMIFFHSVSTLFERQLTQLS